MLEEDRSDIALLLCWQFSSSEALLLLPHKYNFYHYVSLLQIATLIGN